MTERIDFYAAWAVGDFLQALVLIQRGHFATAAFFLATAERNADLALGEQGENEQRIQASVVAGA